MLIFDLKEDNLPVNRRLHARTTWGDILAADFNIKAACRYTMIDLESIIRTAHAKRRRLCDHSGGIYLLYDGYVVVYVGRGWNCLLRVAEHTRKESDKIFTHWACVEEPSSGERDKLERALIRTLNPKYNVTHRKKS